mmetsp:Transcript_34244/g.81927  ORF Transcript_34244/g.81927 Transcript_34244/m.81927 type:complete len:378 (+) Transcript_34244:2513-3646(+)
MPFLVSPEISASDTAINCSMKSTMPRADKVTDEEKTLSINTSFTAARTAFPLLSSISRADSEIFGWDGSDWRNWSSESSPDANRCRRPSCEMHCKIGDQLSPRFSPSIIAMPSRVRMHSMFLLFISLIEPSVVNLASELTNVFRARDIPLCAEIRIEYMKPLRHRVVMVSSDDASSTCDKVPMRGPHVTSNMGFTTSEGETESMFWLVDAATEEPCDPFRDKDFVVGFFLKSCSAAAIISSRSWRNFSRFFSSALDPNKEGPSKTNSDSNVLALLSLSAFSLASSSSFSENGFSLIRLKMPRRKSSGRSPPSAMPLLFRKNDSIVIRRSSLMLGLCRSVFSMMTENPRINAVSGEGNTSLFWRVKRSANFSMILSIF